MIKSTLSLSIAALLVKGARAFEIRDLGRLPGATQFEWGNADGSVRRAVQTSLINDNQPTATAWQDGRGFYVPPRPAWTAASVCRAISHDGSTILCRGTTNGREHGFLVRGNSLIDMGDFGSHLLSDGVSISGDGRTVIGNTFLDDDGAAFIWREGQGYQELRGPNGSKDPAVYELSADGSTYAGEFADDSGTGHIYRYRNDSFSVLPVGYRSPVVNADGSLIALAYPWSGLWIWGPDGTLENLGTYYGATSLDPRAISADGSIICGRGLGGGTNGDGFIWTRQRGMRRFKDFVHDYQPIIGQWTFTSVRGISDDGMRFIGSGRHNGVSTNFLVVVPEPSAMISLSLGLLGILSAKYRKRFSL